MPDRPPPGTPTDPGLQDLGAVELFRTHGAPKSPSDSTPEGFRPERRLPFESAPTDQSPPPKLSPLPQSASTQPDPPPLRMLPSEMEPVVGQVLVGRYRLVKKLGAGGMGVVFQARDEALNLDVALKILPVNAAKDRVAIERFRKEATLVRDIPHAGVCRVYEFREDGPVPFFTMDLIDGRTLRQVMREDEPTVAEVYALLLQIAQALEAVHAKRVVHRDLKPDNVLVRSSGEAVLVDFGLAKNSLLQGATTTGIAGTPKYMSPEQLSGESFDVRTDVFSFGVMAFEILSGQAPFGTGSDAQIITAILRDAPARFECAEVSSEVERGLLSFFAVALTKSPADRFASAAEMRVAFEEAWAGRGLDRERSEVPPPVKIPTAPVPKEYRSRTWLPVSLLISVLVVVAIVWTIVRPPPVGVKQAVRLEKSFLACDSFKPTVEVLPFKNASGESKWDSFASSVADSLRGHLRTSPKLNVAQENAEYGHCPTAWVVNGSVQKIGEKMRLSVEVREKDTGGALVPPIEVDGGPTETDKVLEKARDILLDDLRRQSRFKERDRRAYFGTKNKKARKLLFDFYGLVGPNTDRRIEDLEVGKKLLDVALAMEPNYVAARVEHADLMALGVGVETRIIGLEKAIEDLEQALSVAPHDAEAVIANCRVRRLRMEVEDCPSDDLIDAAQVACDVALTMDPNSAQVRMQHAHLYEHTCKMKDAVAIMERLLEDIQKGTLSRRLLPNVSMRLVALALQSHQLPVANRVSQGLVEIEGSSQVGISPPRGAHLLRGAVLLRLATDQPQMLDAAALEFQKEIERASEQRNEELYEAAAIQGIIGIARHKRKTVPQDLAERAQMLERYAETRAESDPSIPLQLVAMYYWTDARAALKWTKTLDPATSFEHTMWHALVLDANGRRLDALQAVSGYKTKYQWESHCKDLTIADLSR